MSQENTENQPQKTLSLQDRMKAQQQQPGSPPSAYVPPVPAPSSSPPSQPRTEVAKAVRSEKSTVRASHFVDEDGIAWTRTGLTLPAAFWRGIVAYTNQAKLQWQPGQEKTTQQQLIVEAIGTWLNDHRSDIPASVNAECDQVRKLLR